MKSKKELEEILNEAFNLGMNQALSLLNTKLNDPDSLCFECLDKIMQKYKGNRGAVSVDLLCENLLLCNLLLQHRDELVEFS